MVVTHVAVQLLAVVGAAMERAVVRRVPARLLVAPPLRVAHLLGAAVELEGAGPGHGRQDLLQRPAPDVADRLSAEAHPGHAEAAARAGRMAILALYIIKTEKKTVLVN